MIYYAQEKAANATKRTRFFAFNHMDAKVDTPLDIEKVPAKKPKSVRVAEIEPGVWLYSDGMKRNALGHTVELPEAMKSRQITSDTAHDMIRIREAKKHAVLAKALNREVQPELIAEFGEYAYMAEGAINMQRIATSPEAGKAAVMAFESIMEHTGHGKRKAGDAGETVGDAIDQVRGLLRDIAGAARDMATIPVQLRDTIEGEVRESE